MLSIMIVDDERGVIELIKNLIDYDLVEVTIVGEVQNGVDAYNMILEKKPDFVITDIRMPGLTGLELIEKVKAVRPETAFAVISGYRDFEYAQAALKFGVIDYLLKPIKKSELNELLSRISDKVAHEMNQKNEVIQIQQRLDVSNSLLRKNTFWEIIERREINPVQQEAMEHIFNFFAGSFCVIAVKVDYTGASGEKPAYSSVSEVFVEKFMRKLREDCFDAESVCRGPSGYILINFSDRRHQTLEQKKAYLTDLMRNDFYQYDFFDISVGVGAVVSDLHQLPYSYTTAVIALRNRIDFGPENVTLYDRLPIQRQKEPALAAAKAARLSRAVELLDIPEALAAVRSVISENREEKNNFKLYGLCQQMLGTIYEEVKKITPQVPFPQESRVWEELDSCYTVPQLQETVCRRTEEILEKCVQTRQNQDSKPIRQIKQYVAEHYAESIALEDMAKLVYLNPVYISSLFKKETGMSFTTYLTDVRIEQAKRLLKETSIGIAEIARMVGYNDAKHFSKLFTKTVGIKPVEFRKFYS